MSRWHVLNAVALLALWVLLQCAWTSLAMAQDAESSDAIDLGENEASAQPGDTEQPPAEEIDLGTAQVLGTRSLQAMLGDSHALTVLDAAEFASAASVGEALERVPGMDVHFQGGQGQLATAQLRGSRADQVLVLIDGQPVAPGAAADLSTIPLDSVERVEVLRGPEAARFGTGALGGVVNFITRQVQPSPKEDLPSYFPLDEHKADLMQGQPCGTSLAELEVQAGSDSSGGAAIAWRGESLALRFSHHQARNDYAFQRIGGGSATRQNNDASQDELWGSWRAGGLQQRLTVSQLDRDVPGSAEFPTLEARLKQQQVLWQGAGGDWRISFAATRTHYSDPTPYLHTGAIDSRSTRLRLETAFGSLATLAGPWGVKPYVDYIDSSDYGSKQRLGIELHRHWTAGNVSQWSADLGLTAATGQDLAPLARVGWSHNVNKAWSAYGAAGYAVRFPDFEELYLRGSGAVQGNPALNPERALSCEAGIKAALPRASLQAAAFATDYRNAIIFVPVSGYLVKAANTGPARVAGAEALLDWRLGHALWWRTAYTWLPVAQYNSGVALTGRARQHANTRLEWNGADWRYALSLDYTGRLPADLLGSLMIKPRALCGLEVEHKWGRSAVSLNLSNLFSIDARDSWNYPLPGREINLKWKVKL